MDNKLLLAIVGIGAVGLLIAAASGDDAGEAEEETTGEPETPQVSFDPASTDSPDPYVDEDEGTGGSPPAGFSGGPTEPETASLAHS